MVVFKAVLKEKCGKYESENVSERSKLGARKSGRVIKTPTYLKDYVL